MKKAARHPVAIFAKHSRLLAAAVSLLCAGQTARANTELDVPNGTTDLTTLGAGTGNDLTFTGIVYNPATFTVPSALSIGTLDNSATNALAITNGATITLNGGANVVAPSASDLLYVSNNFAFSITGGTLALAAAGNIDIAANTTTISSAITDSGGGFTKTGAGTLTLSSTTSTYTGGTSISAGTLIVAASSTPTTGTVTSGPLGTGTITLAGGRLSNDGTARTLANAISVTGTTGEFTTGGANLTLSGAVTGSGTFTVGNSFVNTTAASVVFNNNLGGFSGTVNFIGNNTDNLIFKTALNTTARFTLSGPSTGTGVQSIRLTGTSIIGELSGTGGSIIPDSGSPILQVNQNTDTTYGGVFALSIALTKAGIGSLSLTNASTYTGATSITGGALNIASGGSISTSNLAMSNGTKFNIAGNLTSSATQANSQQLIRGTVTQTAGAVNVLGLDLADTAGDTASYYLGGAGSVTAGKGKYDSLSVGARGVSSFYVSGSSSVTVTGSAESQTSNSDPNQLTVGSVFSGPTAGTSTFVQQGGTVTTNGLSLGGANSTVTPGIYYLNGGTLTSMTLTRGSNAASSGTLSFGGGTFKNSAAISTDANLTTRINSGGATIDSTSGNLTWSGAILAGNTGTVTGFTGLSGGSGSTPGQIPLTFSAPASGTTAAGVAIVDQSGVVTDIVITNPGSGYTSAPTITGLPGGALATATFNNTAGGLTKTGSNSLTLIGNNTFTGTTTVSGGILTASGTAGTNKALGGTTGIAVNNGSTLLFGTANQASTAAQITLGTAAVTGPPAVAATTGILSVATGANQGSAITVTNGVASSGTSTAGLGALMLNNTSTLNYAGSATTLVFGAFTSNNGSLLNITGYSNATATADRLNSGGTGDDRLIFSGTAAPTNDFAFNGNAAGFGVTEIPLDTGFYEVAFTAVPEPSTWACVVFLLGGLALYQYRRSRRAVC